MAITITGGTQTRRTGSFQSDETLTGSTATTIQTLDVSVPVHVLGQGTATGFGVNRYLLPTSGAAEGQEAVCITEATGETHLVFTGTATGALVYQSDGDFAQLRLINGTWFQDRLFGPTLATATGTA